MILALLLVSVESVLNIFVYCTFYRYNRGLQGSVTNATRIHALATVSPAKIDERPVG
jgi:hypothetical protein